MKMKCLAVFVGLVFTTTAWAQHPSQSFAELNELVSLYGQDAQIFLLTCLIDQIDFRESKTQPKSGAAAKVCFLKFFFLYVLLNEKYLVF